MYVYILITMMLQKNCEETKKYVGIGMALGIVFGAVVGQAIFGNVGVGVGMIFGPVIGAAISLTSASR
jgi:hypothetical protein